MAKVETLRVSSGLSHLGQAGWVVVLTDLEKKLKMT
jgi:hypothetical protein